MSQYLNIVDLQRTLSTSVPPTYSGGSGQGMSYNNFTPDAADSDSVSGGAVSVIAEAGSGTYTYKLVLLTTNSVAGDEADIYIELPQSVNPTVEVRNGSAAGTLLHTISGVDFTPTYQNVRFRFNGTAWVKFTPTI